MDGASTSSDSDTGPLQLSAKETEVLSLYERLHETRLEIALLKAQQSYKSNSTGTVDGQQIQVAQDALLEARALYRLRQDIIDSIMTANPILKAVHNGRTSSPVERDLLPYIRRRDAASIAVAKQSLEMRAALDELTKVESESLQVSRQNVELAAELLDLAGQAARNKSGPVDDPDAARDVRRAEAALKASRQKWKIMKGTASAVVAGSGVDWARDPQLREIVLDPKEES